MPDWDRFGIGAVAEGGVVVINEAAVHRVGATPQQLQDTIDSETRELQRRVQAYRGGRPHLPVAGDWRLLERGWGGLTLLSAQSAVWPCLTA